MSTMKISWGTRVAVLYGGFVVLMVTLVTLAMKQDFQLVSKDYYQKEIQYQEVIDAGKNQATLSAPVVFKANSEAVTIALPEEFAEKIVTGNVEFYAPVDAKFDAKFALQLESNSMSIPRTSLHPTKYQVKINWEAEGKKYYQETTLNLFKQ
ncbi:MAG TPA: FixH family protein [Flavipsychrobacter sp.]|nr:FixH family protein [Flavipsychrobacter sp.]